MLKNRVSYTLLPAPQVFVLFLSEIPILDVCKGKGIKKSQAGRDQVTHC